MSDWERRFMVGPPRLQEVVDLYESMGLEVKLEAVLATDLPAGCHDCRAAMALFRVVYTRPGPAQQAHTT
ncbi:hypothetical protein IV102_06200 [bacterium]|nr:hypothetical protein [bacterium]